MMLKILIKFGDKALCGLVVLWVIWQVVVGLAAINNDPAVAVQVKKSQQTAISSNPSPVVDSASSNIHEKILQNLQWKFDAATRRPSLSFVTQKVDVNILQKEYDAKLVSHVCEMVDNPSVAGGKACLFPGCEKQVLQPDVSIGCPGALKCLDVSAMTVELTWEGVADLKEVTPMYCVVQRKIMSSGNGESMPWVTIVESDGSPKKVIGRLPGDLADPASVASSTLPSGFQLPVGVVGNADSTVAKTVVEKVEDKPVYRFLDYNLEPNTSYSYRVKAVGMSKRDNTIVDGLVWTAPIVVRTKEDQGVGFVRFIPGLRNKEGQLVKKADGSIVSPDKVYVRVTKLFTPPWSPVRYFINYEHRNIALGQEGQDRIGRIVNNYAIVSSDGSPVYIDSKKEKFLSVSPTLSLDALKQQVELNKDNWKPYLMEVNFSTSWKALRVEEEIISDKIMKTKYNAKGQIENVEESIKKYRYFLILENLETKSNLRLELEREDLTKRLLSY